MLYLSIILGMILAFAGGAFTLWVGLWIGSKQGIFVPPPPLTQPKLAESSSGANPSDDDDEPPPPLPFMGKAE